MPGKMVNMSNIHFKVSSTKYWHGNVRELRSVSCVSTSARFTHYTSCVFASSRMSPANRYLNPPFPFLAICVTVKKCSASLRLETHPRPLSFFVSYLRPKALLVKKLGALCGASRCVPPRLLPDIGYVTRRQQRLRSWCNAGSDGRSPIDAWPAIASP